jgi:hypothetical protein
MIPGPLGPSAVLVRTALACGAYVYDFAIRDVLLARGERPTAEAEEPAARSKRKADGRLAPLRRIVGIRTIAGANPSPVVFRALVPAEDEAREPSGDTIDHHDRVGGDGRGDAERHADAAAVETLLDDMRAACRRVRDAWSELWR